MGNFDQGAGTHHEEDPGERPSAPDYRFETVLPDGQVFEGEIAERPVPEGIWGKCTVPERHATMAAVIDQVDRLTGGPKVHVVRLEPLREDPPSDPPAGDVR